MKIDILDNLMLWEHEKLCVVGCLGKLESGLEEIPKKLHGWDFANVEYNADSEFLGGFRLKPTIDITIEKNSTKETHIMAYSLQRESCVKNVRDATTKIGFRYLFPAAQFAVSKLSNALIEIETYNTCKNIAKATGDDVELVCGAIRYTHFLTYYKKIPQETSIMLAAKAFNLPFFGKTYYKQ